MKTGWGGGVPGSLPWSLNGVPLRLTTIIPSRTP